MNIDLTNKRAVVCGSTQGIGRAIAIELASSGANIILIARNEESLIKVLRELPASKTQNHNFIVADFSEPEKLKRKLLDFASENPPVHILINNTGGPKAGEAITADTKEFIEAFSNHLICNQIWTRSSRTSVEGKGSQLPTGILPSPEAFLRSSGQSSSENSQISASSTGIIVESASALESSPTLKP